MGLPLEIKVFMHGFIPGPSSVVNAEVDSMEVVFDRGACVGKKPYPQLASIEEVRTELRQEYNVREERAMELEFLEKGGEPLEFKLSNAVSLGVHSTSVTDQQPDQLVNSEGKGSIACTTSPHGNSVESSGRPEAHPLSELNCADNLPLFCGEKEVPDENPLHRSKKSSTPSDLPTQLDGPVNAKDKKDSIPCSLLTMAYKRRSRPNRDGSRSRPSDIVLAHVGYDLSSCHASRDVQGLVPYTEIQKDQHVSMDFNLTPPSPNSGTICKSSGCSSELDSINEAVESIADQLQGFPESASDANASEDLTKDRDNGKTAVIDKTGGELVSEDLVKCWDHSELKCVAHMATTKVEDQANSSQKGGIRGSKEDEKALHVIVHSNKTEVAATLLDSESSCTFVNRNIYGCSDNEILTNERKVNSNGDVEKQTLVPEVTSLKEVSELEEEKKETQPDLSAILNEDNYLTYRNFQGNGLVSLSGEELKRNAEHLKNEVKGQVEVETVQAGAVIEKEKNCDSCKTGISVSYPETAPLMVNLSNKSSILELPECPPSVKTTSVTVETKESDIIARSRADEDAILKEAHAIQAKRKRVSELNVTTFHMENHKRSQWNYVLEEMAWLANDFAQERLWKMTAAAQLCHRVADTSLLTYQEKDLYKEKRKVAHALSKAIMTFWNSVQKENQGMDLTHQKDSAFTISEYAKRFIKFNSSNISHSQTTLPATTDRIGHLRTMDTSQDNNWTELQGSLFYQVPFNAMEAYRGVIESHLKIGNSLLEGETSARDVTDLRLIENGYKAAGEEPSIYNCDISKSSKFAQKKRKIMIGYGVEPQNVGADLMQTQFFENKHLVKKSVLVGKRSAGNLNVSIPTNRVRTASTQRVLSPYTAGTFGCVPLTIKAEASNADISPFQKDLDGRPIMPNSLELEPSGDFGKSFPLDSTEVHMPKRKKNGSAHEQNRQVDSNFHSEQRDQPRKKPESQHLESSGLLVHILKMPNSMMPSVHDNNFGNVGPVTGSIPSPVTAQMTIVPNSNKLLKIFSGGDQSWKAILSNVPTRQQGSGVPWSLSEDQALVVLVHDIGPCWELVSHIINSTLKLKCIYRNPKECKERHKILMDKTTADEADTAGKLGSTKPYPYTLPGIPQGSAMKLFEHLQGPVEEKTLKSHFEKIILIMQKFQYGKVQNDTHDHKQLPQPDSSHMLALSQVCPNNLSGGGVLTPLDLCDAITSSPDILSDGFQRSHITGLSMPNPCSVALVLLASDINNYSQSSAFLSSSLRDGRCAVSQSASLSAEEQNKMQKYKHILPARNIQQQTPSGLGNIHEINRGMQVPSRRGTRMMTGGNRSSSVVARPGLQSMAPSMLNSGSMVSSGMVSVQSPVHNMHSATGVGHMNSVARPRTALHVMQPSWNQETERPILAPELHIQVSQAINRGVPPHGPMSSSLSNRASRPPVSSYPSHHQLSHPISSLLPHQLGHHPRIQGTNHASKVEHQAYALRLAREKQLQHRFLQQKQQKQQLQMPASKVQNLVSRHSLE